MKPRHKCFDVPIFRSQFHLAIAETLPEAAAKIPKDFDRSAADDNAEAAGLMLNDAEGGYAVLLVVKHCDLNTIAHELTHVVIDMLHRNGVKIDS